MAAKAAATAAAAARKKKGVNSKDRPSEESTASTRPGQASETETATETSQLSAKSKDEDPSTSTSRNLAASPVLGTAIPVQQTAIELFDELELPISSAVWGVTSAKYINGTNEVNPNIPKLQSLTLVPISGDSAAHKLFGTVELLELILESCTYRDLLCHLPRVNSTWKAIIDENKFIQQHLFFLPWQENDYI